MREGGQVSIYNKASEKHLPADERRGIHPAVREAESIIARNWRRAHRRQRQAQAIQVMVLCYGITLWTLASLCVAVIFVPHHPTIGAAAILALSGLGLALLGQWRAWWRRSWYVEPVPYVQSRERVMRGGSL